MQNKNHYCIIMAGGIGSRFWPMSRQSFPKQFHDILGTGKTLLQETVDRFRDYCPIENIYIVTNKQYFDLVNKQIPGLDPNQILLEPVRRNTAPCIAYAMSKIYNKNDKAVMVIAPADHLIIKPEAFLKSINLATEFAESKPAIVTLGIQPNRPDTGYGYIQFIPEKVEQFDGISRVKTFTEKPNLELAKAFVKSGEFLWNSGIFISSATTLINTYKMFLSDMLTLFQPDEEVYYTDKEADFVERAYTRCTNISIDYGIIEKAKNVYVIPSNFGWSDLGTWGSLYENAPKDEYENAALSRNVLFYDTKECIINAPKSKLVVIEGLKDYIVIDTKDVLLICRKDKEQAIKQIVTDVKAGIGDQFV
jgi:mannose-1-phosphate guanylyltransferase